jgi:hypothetical protein
MQRNHQHTFSTAHCKAKRRTESFAPKPGVVQVSPVPLRPMTSSGVPGSVSTSSRSLADNLLRKGKNQAHGLVKNALFSYTWDKSVWQQVVPKGCIVL